MNEQMKTNNNKNAENINRNQHNKIIQMKRKNKMNIELAQ